MVTASSLSQMENKVGLIQNAVSTNHGVVLEVNNAIKDMKDSMETAITSTDKEMIQLRKNSGDSLKMFKSMNRCLEKVECVNTTLPYEVSSKNPERSTKRHHQGKKDVLLFYGLRN